MAVNAAVRSTSAFGWKGDTQICAILLGNRRPEFGGDDSGNSRFSPKAELYWMGLMILVQWERQRTFAPAVDIFTISGWRDTLRNRSDYLVRRKEICVTSVVLARKQAAQTAR